MATTRRRPWDIMVPVAGTWLILASVFSRFEVAPTGTSSGWWAAMCGVELPGRGNEGRYAYSVATLPRLDTTLYYQYQHHHGVWLFRLPLSVALADTGTVLAELSSPDRDTTTRCYGCTEEERYRRNAYLRAACRTALPGITLPLDSSSLDAWRSAMPPDSARQQRVAEREQDFRERMTRGERVWMSLLFEGLFLTGWWIFFAHAFPSRSPVRWRRYLGLAPFVLFMPYFLNYAPLTFSSGPSGGFVYPVLLKLMSLPLMFLPCTPVDEVLWKLFPPLLSGLNQIPGSPTAMSFMGCVGPASSLVGGVLLMLIFSGLGRLRRRRQPSPSS